MLKKMYQILALMALLNMFAIGGGVAYLLSNGFVNREKIQQIGQVMRGEVTLTEITEEATEEGDADTATDPTEADANQSSDLSLQSQHQQEIVLREVQRFRDEMDQRMALNNRIMLQITTKREALERNIQAFEQSKQVEAEVVEDVAFKKELEIFETLKSAVALERLLAKSNIDDAARMMQEMETRKVAKMIEAAKTPVQKQKLQTVMERLRIASPEKYDTLTEGP